MFNDSLLMIIAAVAIVLVTLVFLIVKRKTTPQADSTEQDKKEIPQVVTEEQVEVVPEIEEAPKVEQAHEDKEPTNRRKCDITIKKRAVPEHGIITKQNFSEFSGERILVAEDNPINQKVLLGLLGGSGIEVILANDGQEALDILENDTNFVMILMDAHMPRIDGFEATRIIRENPKFDHIVVVALSGDIASDDIQKMKDAGMSEHLAKPLRMESLYNMIYAYTGQGTQNDSSVEVTAAKSLYVEKGLQTCGGDEEFYREILSEFMSDYSNSSDTLGELLRSNNMHDADAYLLDIIGVAENIGAHPLGEIASNMKLALGDTHDQSYFSLYDQYKAQHLRLMDEIRKYLLREF